MAGVHLGVFEAIGHEARTTDEVAQSVAADSECVELLLRVLACAGYVAREGSRYRLTEASLGAFVGDGHARLSGLVEWAYYQWAWVERLEEVVKSGAGVDAIGSLKTPEDWAVAQKAMLEVGRMWAPPLAPLVPVNKGARRMLDIGGSHGLYGAMICREHPAMCSEVLDLPDAVEHARRLAHLEGIDDVVTFREGNALKDDLGGRYDVVFVDLGMPGMSGDQVIREMRQTDSALAAVLITGWELEESDPRRGFFDFWIQKPFAGLDDIESVVARAIKLHDKREKEGQG
jgi:CheY-like chemotaxis protein